MVICGTDRKGVGIMIERSRDRYSLGIEVEGIFKGGTYNARFRSLHVHKPGDKPNVKSIHAPLAIYRVNGGSKRVGMSVGRWLHLD